MEKEILKEALKGCNNREKFFAKLFPNVVIKAYKRGFKKGFYLAN